ncbi:hypothetical protein A8924_7110 [Saccharopolyspora erythraea NRRL 2338]|uniref:Uncharacterized protein n=2 Tax=Saccharopolyspora erythraea TaxID=1836 RepID=A4FPE5_SACEN|nr:hypothetical protein [Saccharopolyspora erythraea]EQD82294.1 hypothetical protein N599_31410 [Saccharopolyspora erythraea D]PFG99560.1 hypothetical protein A8924_7110 [Saccharopolyspora erythraea NRRL 2338]QRK89459.1 hypothetical protein JQX30_33800 [Saccharopolyspora erythraea]CAM05920.1 hypothetical protein SACE_6754 [Saccharopolyspora erythraea NRRL 2338]
MSDGDAKTADGQHRQALEVLSERLGRHQVFGTPVQQGDTTLVPVAHVRAGSGFGRAKRELNGGGGVVARPAGAFGVTSDGKVAWHPAVDVNRIVLGGQLAFAAVAIAFAIAFRRRR